MGGRNMLTKEHDEIPHTRLIEILKYQEESGKFTWVQCVGGGSRVGKEAGTVDSLGYIVIRIFGHGYKAHRLAYFYVTGHWPDEVIHHINGVRNDNRWENLTQASYSENSSAQKTSIRNTSGFRNVSRASRGGWAVKVAGHQWGFGELELNEAILWADKMRNHYYGKFAEYPGITEAKL